MFADVDTDVDADADAKLQLFSDFILRSSVRGCDHDFSQVGDNKSEKRDHVSRRERVSRSPVRTLDSSKQIQIA